MPSVLGYGTSTQSVINIGKQQEQLMAFLAEGTLFLAGVVLIGLGELQATMIETRGGIARLLKRGLAEDTGNVETPAPVAEPVVEAEAWSAQPTLATDRNRAMVLALVGLVLALVIGFVMVRGLGSSASPAAAAIENNAEALADNLEAQADNLEAMADAAERNAR